MRKQRRFKIVAGLLAIVIAFSQWAYPTSVTAQDEMRGDSPSQQIQNPAVVNALKSSPVMFIENVGQMDSGARFQVRGANGTIWLADNSLWITKTEKPVSPKSKFSLPGTKPNAAQLSKDQTNVKGVNIKISFPGSNPHPTMETFNRLDTHVSYFIGNDSSKWKSDVPVWGGIRYKDLYPGIDLELTSEQGQMTEHIIAHDGADLKAVQMQVDGTSQLSIVGDELRLTTSLGDYSLPLLQLGGNKAISAKLLPSQIINGNLVISPFRISQNTSANAQPAASISSLLYSTYLGAGNEATSIALDASGEAYVTGYTMSSDFPTTAGAFDTSFNGGIYDAFVTKLNPSGSALVYSTFLGGSSSEMAFNIALDASGEAYVTGYTYSSDFPTTAGAFDTIYKGNYDAFVTKLNPSGSALVYSTFLGGSDYDLSNSVALDASGEAYVTGYTASSDFPTTAGAFDTSYDGGDAFVTKLNPSGSALVYSTYLGAGDEGFSIALNASGEAYVIGISGSPDFPTTAGAFDTSFNGGDYDAFVTKLNPSGSALVYSTFLGGSSIDDGLSIALDASGEAYVTGDTFSSDFPTTAGAFDTSYNGYYDAFVTKLNSSGSALVYSTYLGGSNTETARNVALDASGEAYVTGDTGSSDFPTTAGAFDTSFNGIADAFVTKLNPSGSALVYSTYLGGSIGDGAKSVALDASGEAYVTGDTFSSDFPTTAGAFDTSYDGLDAFVTKLAMRVPSWTIMVYLDGDQSGKNGYPSLDSNYLNVFNQLENAANNPNVNIIVAWDRGGNNAAYYQVQTDGVNSWSKGNLDMGDPTTLSNFIQWVRTNYPAQHYALFISDHGTGLYGTAVDDTSGGDLLTVNELGNALSTATANGQNKLDVVFADSCLMAMIEDEYQIRNYANIYIASENPIAIPLSDSNDSKPYSNYIAAITSSTTPPELATEIVNNYASWLNNDFPAFGYTLSAVDLTKINPLINAIGSLAVALQAQMPTYSAKIQTARDSTQKFDEFDKGSIDNSDEYVDLDDLASELKNIPDTGIQNAAQSVIDAEGAYVIPGAYVAESGSRVYPYPSLDPSRVHGVSIFTPTGQLKRSFYDGLNLDFASGAVWGSGSSKILFSSDTLGWGPFLVNYVESVTPNATDDPNPPELASPVEAGFIISGNAGIAGATLTYIGGSTTSGSDGSYTIAVPTGWSGIITPSKTGYTFSPPDLDYSTTPVTTNLTDQDFTAIVNTYTLTYTAGPHGSITGTSPQTVNYGGNGTAVTAVPATGYHFVNWSDSSTANPRTDTNVTTNISVTANFAIGVERTKNGGFNTYVGASKIPQYWTASKFQTTDGKDTTTFAEGTASVKIIGKSGVTKTLTQTIIQSGLAGDKFTFSFQAKGSSIPVAGLCQAQVKLYSGTKLISTLSTVNCATSTYLFRLKTLKFTAPKAYNKIVVVFTYSKATGTVWFDAVSLMR